MPDVTQISPTDAEAAAPTELQVPDPVPVEVKKPTLNALIWGPPGVGKTVLAATAADHPELGPALVLNIEGGLLSLGTRKNVDTVHVGSFEALEAYFWKITSRQKPYDKYKTVIIDSATELQTLSLEGVVKNEVEKARKKGGENSRKSIDEIFVGDYGKDTARLKRVFRWFRDAPVNVIFTALSKEVLAKSANPNDPPKVLSVEPWLTSKLAQALMGYVDFVWYLNVGQDESKPALYKKRVMLTRDVGLYKGKTRGINFSNSIGEVVVEPNLATLYNVLLKTEGSSK